MLVHTLLLTAQNAKAFKIHEPQHMKMFNSCLFQNTHKRQRHGTLRFL